MADEYKCYVQARVRGYHAYFVDATVYIEEVMDCKQVGYVSINSLSSIDLESAFSCHETLLNCRQTLLSCRTTHLSCRQTLIICQQTLLNCHQTLTVVVKPFLAVAKPSVPVAKLLLFVAKPSIVVTISCLKNIPLLSQNTSYLTPNSP